MRSWALACALATGAASAQSPAVQVTRITWLAGDTVAVDAKGSRPSDRIIDWVAQRSPGVVHERLVANAKRSWALIQRGEQVCHASAVRSAEREALAYFTNTVAMPPLQLIVRRDRLAALPLDAEGQVDLAAVLADTRLQGLLVQGRSYGPALDALLARRPPQAAVRELAAADFGSNLMGMLQQRRVDYAIEYPIVLSAVLHQRSDMDDLVGVPIRGTSELVVSGIACPRTPWGQAAIRLIDRTLATPQAAAMLRSSLVKEMGADDLRRYRAALDDFFRRRSQPTPGL